MQTDLSELRITPDQLEKLTGLDISDTFMGKAYRPAVFRSAKRLFSFLLTEALTFGVILIFCLPVILVIAHSLGTLNSANTGLFLLIALATAVAIFAGWNLFMKLKGRNLQTLAHLLDEVDKHNEIIAAVHVLDELSVVQSSSVQLIDRAEVLKALFATRESLINALITEKILRKHQRFITRRRELFTSIETNLATLQTLQVDNQANEYGQLLNEALKIALSVRQEINRFNQE